MRAAEDGGGSHDGGGVVVHGADEHDAGASLGLDDDHSLGHASQGGERPEGGCSDEERCGDPAEHSGRGEGPEGWGRGGGTWRRRL